MTNAGSGRRGSTFVALLGLSFSCAAEEPLCSVTVVREELVNGTARARYLKLDPGDEGAVAHVRLRFLGLGSDEFCSGVLVSPAFVLTARHCAHGLDPLAIEVAFGRGADEPELLATAWVAAVHPDLDVMLLGLDQPVGAEQATPIAIASSLPTALGAGSLVQVAGFGVDGLGSSGQRQFLVEELEAFDERELSVSASGLGGACFGDSGGPLLVRGDDGSVQVLAVLSSGDPSCTGRDRYVRVDALFDWARAAGVEERAQPPLRPHPELGGEGRCYGPTAVWGDEDGVHASVCSEGLDCGWSEAAGGYRCVGVDADRCGGVDDVGTCMNGDALRCVRGHLEVEPCETCGFACGRSPMSGDATCLGGPSG